MDKYIAWNDDGEPVGITTLTKHLESVPWISPEYFAAHYPEHWARHAVYYLGFTLAHPSIRQHGFLEAIIEVGMAPLAAERAVMGYDVCAYNNTALGFTERINDILERYPLVQLAAVDTQVYYAVTFVESRYGGRHGVPKSCSDHRRRRRHPQPPRGDPGPGRLHLLHGARPGPRGSRRSANTSRS